VAARAQALRSTEGSRTEQTLVCGGAGIKLVAVDGDETATRSWPMDYDGGIGGAGYEFVDALDLPRNAARIREEALELLSAPPCPAGGAR
jgi:TldD protein